LTRLTGSTSRCSRCPVRGTWRTGPVYGAKVRRSRDCSAPDGGWVVLSNGVVAAIMSSGARRCDNDVVGTRPVVSPSGLCNPASPSDHMFSAASIVNWRTGWVPQLPRPARPGCVCHKPRLSGLMCHAPRSGTRSDWGACATNPVYRGRGATCPERPRRTPGRVRPGRGCRAGAAGPGLPGRGCRAGAAGAAGAEVTADAGCPGQPRQSAGHSGAGWIGRMRGGVRN
jgi:hypothetical protein